MLKTLNRKRYSFIVVIWLYCSLSRVEGAVHVATPDAAAAIVAAAPPSTSDAPLPGDLGKWHFIADSKL